MSEDSEDIDLDVLWEHMLNYFPVLQKFATSEKKLTVPENVGSEKYDTFDTCGRAIAKNNLLSLLFSLVCDGIKQAISNICPALWKSIETCKGELEVYIQFMENIQIFVASTKMLESTIYRLNDFRDIAMNVSKENPSCVEIPPECTLKDSVMPTLSLKLIQHEDIFDKVYKFHLRAYFVVTSPELVELPSESNPQCSVCNMVDVCVCKKYIEAFDDVCKIPIGRMVLDRFSSSNVRRVAYKEIEQYVTNTCKGNLYSTRLPVMEKWFSVLKLWVFLVYDNVYGTHAADSAKVLTEELHQYMYETHTRVMTSQLFTIIIEYPESLAAVEDFGASLIATRQYSSVAEAAVNDFSTRLLHSAVNTPELLTTYIAAYRTLKHMDPSEYLVTEVTRPMEKFLKQREDAVHCIVSSLTEDGLADLSDDTLSQNRSVLDDPDLQNGPHPLLETFCDFRRTYNTEKDKESEKKKSDIMSIFTNMFGSKMCFIDEYRKLLADRTLTQFDCNLEKELHRLELLKARFGELDLIKCEVMLKDIADSLKVSDYIAEDKPLIAEYPSYICRAVVMSSHFWPPFKEVPPLKLPEEIQTNFDNYTKGYELYKPNRTICWKPHLGVVNLDIIFKDRSITVTVTPLHAIIIHHFQHKERWTIKELHEETLIAPTVLRKKISYWLSQGVLCEESPDVFVVVEQSASSNVFYKPKLTLSMMYEDDEPEQALVTHQEIKEEELQAFWTYIVGMLTNLSSLTLDRILQMLNMFVSHGTVTSEITPAQLKAFLDKKVKANKLIYHGGSYRLPK